MSDIGTVLSEYTWEDGEGALPRVRPSIPTSAPRAVCEDIGHERGGTATGGTDTHHGSGAGDASERCTEYRYSAARYFSLICNCVCTHISRCDSSM